MYVLGQAVVGIISFCSNFDAWRRFSFVSLTFSVGEIVEWLNSQQLTGGVVESSWAKMGPEGGVVLSSPGNGPEVVPPSPTNM